MTGDRTFDDASLPNDCGPESGRVVPVIDRGRCEGKTDCVRVCPHDVFEIQPVPREDKAALSLLGRLKLAAHGGKQAYVVDPQACHGCRSCLAACPEDAIHLEPARH